jgi:hypothetical protein
VIVGERGHGEHREREQTCDGAHDGQNARHRRAIYEIVCVARAMLPRSAEVRMRIRVSVCAWAVAAACAGEYAGQVTVTSPELVPVQPGVEVIADADEPVFYADSYYWLYRDDMWLRSESYRNGFARVDVHLVPERLRQLPEPHRYAHYRHTQQARAKTEPRPIR